MSKLEKNASSSFKNLVMKFLGNILAQNYTHIVQKLLESYKALVCNFSIKLYFLHSHRRNFPENIFKVSNEQVKLCYHDLKAMEEWYQGKCWVNIMADYC